jgi:hypothetical protein
MGMIASSAVAESSVAQLGASTGDTVLDRILQLLGWLAMLCLHRSETDALTAKAAPGNPFLLR